LLWLSLDIPCSGVRMSEKSQKEAKNFLILLEKF